jgi:hypothetical protein
MNLPVPAVVLVLIVGCGQAMATALDTRSIMAPPDAFQCVMKAFEGEDFKRTSYDKDELRTTARRQNDKIQVSNTQFRKAWDVLEVAVASGANGETELKVTASTVGEYFGQRGPVYEPRETSADAQEAARTIASRCGS